MAYDVVMFLENLCQTSRLFQAKELPERWREWYEERAAILEYDGGLTRAEADSQALREIAERIDRINKI